MSDRPIPILDVGGVPRKLACRRTDPARMRAMPSYGAKVAPLPRDRWRPFDDFPHLGYPIKDQGQFGACMGFSTSTAFEIAYNLAYGLEPFSRFSAWYCYSTINGGRDQGATVGDAFASIQTNGLPPDALVQPGTIRLDRIPATTRERARQYRAEGIYRLESEDDLATAVMLRHPVAFGTMIGRDFDRLDADGVPGDGAVIGGHAMCIWGGLKLLRSGQIAYRVINSWAERWGRQGCCWMTFGQVARGYGLDAFALVLPTATPDEADRPPIIRRLP